MTTTPLTGDTWGDEIEGPRAFFLAQSEKPFAELKPIFQRSHGMLVQQLLGVTDAQATFKPGRGDGEEDYSVAEVTRHMIQIYPLMAARIRSLALDTERPATQPPGSLGQHEGAPLSRLRGLLAEAEMGLLAQVSSVEGKERLDTTMPHRLFGELNCRGWLAMQSLHIEDHARQIGKIKSHPDYPKG
ncbi:MAG: hypothetical protein GEU75_06865 [Dehalococcoidia bacterium]|nr:hypothetical protein [Dehalococcoidia bacterium]